MVWLCKSNICNYWYLFPWLKKYTRYWLNSVMINFDPSLSKQCCRFDIQHNHESYWQPSFHQTLAFTRILASFQNSLKFLQFLTKYVEKKAGNLITLNRILLQSKSVTGGLVHSELFIWELLNAGKLLIFEYSIWRFIEIWILNFACIR